MKVHLSLTKPYVDRYWIKEKSVAEKVDVFNLYNLEEKNVLKEIGIESNSDY